MKIAFLPPALSAALFGAARRLTGLGLFALAVALALALLSYDPGDASFNTAADSETRNLLGTAGAHLADLLLQTMGLAGGLIALALAAWGWPLLLRRPLKRLWLRLVLLPPALTLAAIAAAAAPTPADWPLASGLGGAGGALLLAQAVRLAGALGAATVDARLAAVVSGLLAAVVLLPVLAVDLRNWTPGWTLDFGRPWRFLRALAGRLRRTKTVAPDPADDTATRLEPVFGREDISETMAPDLAGELDIDEMPPAPAFLVEPREPGARKGKRVQAERQPRLAFDDPAEQYRLPELDMLEAAAGAAGGGGLDQDALTQNARLLQSVLDDFNVKGEIVKVRPGPVVTLYEFVPAPGTKSSRVVGLAADIARSMSAVSVRVAVIPGRNAIGIEMPNRDREIVLLRELLESAAYERTTAKLPLVLGKDIGGGPVIVDLARMPHLLIAGTTGSGKSVAINTMILSLLYRLPPDACRFIMIDPKMLELSVYDGIPQLLTPVVTEPAKAVVALRWAVREMENRYRSMSGFGVRNIEGYNARIVEAARTGEVLERKVQTGFDAETGEPIYEDQVLDLTPLPYIVVIVDEMADLMMVAGKDIEAAVQRLAQMARAAGIHLIMATQRPSVDVITGTIKANFPTRISFQVTSRIDSRTILGEQGAEALLGHGDMLYMAGGGRVMRVHGPFVSDAEVEEVVRHLKSQGTPAYDDSITKEDEAAALSGLGTGLGDGDGGGGADGALYRQAVALVLRERKASTSFVQRHLQIGYNRAARLIDRMEADGIISAANHVGRREILAGEAHP